jgi:hypothetical protein
MTMSLQNLLAMVWRSITNPREGAEEVLSLGVPRSALWTLLLLVVVLSSILGQITTFLLAGISGAELSGLFAMPIATGVIQFVVLVGTVYAIHFIGRSFGGTGTLDEALLLIAWLQFVMVCIQVVQSLFMVIAPPIGSVIGIVALALFMWLLTNFVAVIHGFRSLGQVFTMILLSLFGIAFILSIILTIFGLTPPGAPV